MLKCLKMGCLFSLILFVAFPLLIVYYIVIACVWLKDIPKRKLLRTKRKTEKRGYTFVFNEYVKDYLQAEEYLLQIDIKKEFLRKKEEKDILYLINLSEETIEYSEEDLLLDYWNNCLIQNEIVKCVCTKGENEYYKGLLQNEKWKRKSELIKKRDIYCQHCFGLIRLAKVGDIMNYVDFPEIGNIIIDIFQRKEYFKEDCCKLYSSNNFNIEKRVEALNVNLYMLEFSPKDAIDTLPWMIYRNSKNGEILSSTPLYDLSDLEGNVLKKETREYTYKMKGQNGTKKNVDIEYFPNVSTDGEIYLRYRFSYSRSDGYGQGIISQDGFSVIFPLYSLNNYIAPLEVHHKAYRVGKNPWDSPDDELITLCSSCHKKEHGCHAIPVYS